MNSRIWLMVVLVFGLGLSRPRVATAQDAPLTPRQQQLLASIHWQNGPCVANLGSVATGKVPAGHQFTDGAGARAFQEASAEPPGAQVVGLLMPSAEKDHWSVFFTYEDIGYVKDDEKDNIDADAILSNIKAATEEGNKYRVQKGGSPLRVVGWEQKPSYDSRTNRLVWALRAGDKDGDVINYNSRMLGRSGVMSANLIVPPADFSSTLGTYLPLLEGFSYVQGQSHSEWRTGDKVAAYGLTALIAGGTGAVLAKSGLLGKLLKPLLAAGAALLAGLAKLAHWLFGKKGGDRADAPPDAPPAN